MLTLIAVVAAIVAVLVIANWRLQFFRWDLLDELGQQQKPAQPEPVQPDTPLSTSEVAQLRARDPRGKFVGDNPNTASNEAFKNGQSPKRRRRRRSAGAKHE